MKTWHIWDFPDTVYLYLKDEVREEFFTYMFNKFGGKRPYARFLRVNQKTVKGYHRGYTYKVGIKHRQCIPISVFKKSIILINNELKEKIEKDIFIIKSKNRGIPIYNPKLPFKESPSFYRIVAHMIGDGSAPKRKVPYYSNQCKELLEQFKEDLKIFGDSKVYEHKPLSTTLIYFPKVITDILSYILEVKFTYPDHIPKIIFEANEECKVAFIRALYDDEGCSSNGIVISMKGENIIKELKSLIESIGIRVNKISISRQGMAYISINSNHIENFKERISFSHPKKIINLNAGINTRNRKQRTRDKEELKVQLLKFLENRNSFTIDIAHNIQLTLGHTLTYLKLLEKENKVVRSGYKNKILWTLPTVSPKIFHNK